MKKKRSSFLLRRLHSLLGIVPIGIFMCVHFLINSTAFAGSNSYYVAIGTMRSVPLIVLLELVIIAIPIIFHALYGLYIVYVAKNNVLRYKYLRNWLFTLQRVTAIVTLLFLLFHVMTLRFLAHGPGDVVLTLAAQLQNPLILVLYCLCVVAAVFHFSNGLFTFLITWGIIQGPRVQRIALVVTMVIFVAMSIWGIAILASVAGFKLAAFTFPFR